VNTGKEQRRIPNANEPIERIAVSPDGKALAGWGSDNPRVILLWNLTNGEKLRTLEVSSEQPQERPALSSLCFAHDGKTLYASSGTHLSVLHWDSATGKSLPLLGKHDGALNGIALSPDDRSLAAVTMNGTLYLWETATRQARLIVKDAGYATSVAFSPDGRLLALANTGNNRLITRDKAIVQGVENREQVRLVRIADGKVIRRFTGHLGGIGCLSFSPDGRTLASGGQDTTVLVWDVSHAVAAEAKTVPPLPAEKFTELWTGLKGKAAEAHGCMQALISSPAQTVPFLGNQLKPVVAVEARRFAALKEKLESDQFNEREEATRELKKLGESAEPALRQALQEKLPLETRRRLQMLLDDLSGTEGASGKRLRTLRAIEILERIADKPAHDVLRRLSKGAAGAWLTEEVRASLRRLER
jgi:WD40 repeat protein